MSKPSQPKPRFTVGDQIVVTSPGIHRDKDGLVIEVIEPRSGDLVYRYRVRFTDGKATTFFGFELEVREDG